MFHNISNPKWFGNWSRLEENFIRYFALLRDMDAFVFVSGRKIDALEDLSGLPLAGNCSGLDIDRILQRPKCLG